MKKRLFAMLLCLSLCLGLLPAVSLAAGPTAYARTQAVELDGSPVTFEAYALKDPATGYETNYVKLRDVALALTGTPAQFEVGWDGAVNIVTGQSYTPNGTENKTPWTGDRAYIDFTGETRINGVKADLAAITLTDDNGGGYTYYKLRDLGNTLGFVVDWTAEKGVIVFADGELAQGQRLGFVPSALWGALDETVTVAQFSTMLTDVVESLNSDALAEFKAALGDALTWEETATRADAGVALYYANTILKIPERTTYRLPTTGEIMNSAKLRILIGDDEFGKLRWGYPEGVFPKKNEPSKFWNMISEEGVVAAAYQDMVARSSTDGKLYFEYDVENNTLHMDREVTVDEAIRAIVRYWTVARRYSYLLSNQFMEDVRAANAATTHKNPISDKTTAEIVDDITMGICLYNALDYTYFDHVRELDHAYVSGYDNMVEKVLYVAGEGSNAAFGYFDMLDAFAEAGFNTVWLEVTWSPYTNDETFEIDPEFLDLVEYYANYAMDRGMYVFINAIYDYKLDWSSFVGDHWSDEWMDERYAAYVDARYKAIWTQIAERFKDYDEHLMFEATAEVQERAFPSGAEGQKQAARNHTMNQIFVDAFRDSGGNNATRSLLVSHLWEKAFTLPLFEPPKDDHLIATVHFYYEGGGEAGVYGVPEAAFPEKNDNNFFLSWSRDQPGIKAWMDGNYGVIKAFQERTGIPMIMGEFTDEGKGTVLTLDEMMDMLTATIEQARSLNMPSVWWPSYSDYESLDPLWFDREANQWVHPELVQQMMETALER